MEVMISMAISGVVFSASMSALLAHRIQMTKDRDLGIVRDFVIHYVELVKGMPFDEIRPGAPISALYDGTNGAPNIRIPVTSAPISLTQRDYQTFHPELTWLEEQHPQMRVNLEITYKDQVEHTKLLSVEVTWDSPLGQGSTQVMRVDILRTVDM
ncbi:MAG: hypothetical protein Kow0059_19070 [Candidatus Sumerlaeia bacterium]